MPVISYYKIEINLLNPSHLSVLQLKAENYLINCRNGLGRKVSFIIKYTFYDEILKLSK